jgi:hypothetical protein
MKCQLVANFTSFIVILHTRQQKWLNMSKILLATWKHSMLSMSNISAEDTVSPVLLWKWCSVSKQFSYISISIYQEWIHRNLLARWRAFGTASAFIYNNLGDNTDWRKLFYHVVSDVNRNRDNVKQMYIWHLMSIPVLMCLKICLTTICN